MAETGKEALAQLKDNYHAPRDVELFKVIEQELDRLENRLEKLEKLLIVDESGKVWLKVENKNNKGYLKLE